MTTEKTRVEGSSKTKKKKGVQQWKERKQSRTSRKTQTTMAFVATTVAVCLQLCITLPNASPPLVNFANFLGNLGYSELLWRVKG
jgi:hypothetical protein